ncbi:MAG TPA: FprA family A-type flavoprotein [Bacteroidales bacterium]|nr:FprA family A-type flavoprotein [Bacteroidales bacterium]
MATDTNGVISITKDVSWIGILDNDIVTFDIVMETRNGTTYNSYFIDAGKKAIIDTAKETFRDEYLSKVKKVVNPSGIDYIIVNHTEPDHSGSLKYLLDIAPHAIVYGSRQAINYLNEMVGRPFNSCFVKDGDTLDLDGKTLKFISAPNLHWPDTIYTYLEEDKILFTCDSFGSHYCNELMFDDLVGDFSQSFKYYFDVILRPFSKYMLNALDKIRPLKINTICPGHGPILRTRWKELLEKTSRYAEIYLANATSDENNILITYVSAYGYTRQMAELIARGISEVLSCNVNIVDIEHILPGDLEELIVKSNSILIGSPTINQNTLLPVYKMFSLFNPLRDKGKKATAFGSYGWSGEAVKLIENQLKALKLDVVCEGISSRFSPNNEKSEKLIEFGKNFARQLLLKKKEE